MPAPDSIGWFEIGTDDPATAARFLDEVLGWTVSHDDSASTDPACQVLSTGDGRACPGGLFATRGQEPATPTSSCSSTTSQQSAGRRDEFGGDRSVDG